MSRPLLLVHADALVSKSMSTRLKIILGLPMLGLVALAGLAWYLGFFSDDPDEASLADATATLAESESAAGDGDAAAGGTITDLTGTWTVETGEATYVGYRVNEVLSTVGDFTAVGRTPLVEGSLEADGLTITAVTITADLTGLKSNSSQRDRSLGKQGLETGTFPEGSFALTSPIQIETLPAEGDLFTTMASGELTLHGETRPVELQVEGTVQGSRLVIIGRMDIVMSDFGIEPPSAPLVASIEDQGVMELSLIFVQA